MVNILSQCSFVVKSLQRHQFLLTIQVLILEKLTIMVQLT